MNNCNILVKRTMAYGDVLLTIPALRGLKEKNSNCKITFLSQSPYIEVIKGHPLINKIVTDEEEIAKDKYDLFYNFDLSYEKDFTMHIIDAYCQEADVKPSHKGTSIALNREHKDLAQFYLNKHDYISEQILIGLHSGGASWPCKLWGKENFKYVLEFFQEILGVRVIELGGRDCQPIGLDMNLIGKTSIKETAAVLKKCDLLLGIDSLPLHLAGAVDTPVVAVFGCTDPDKILPFNNISWGIQSDGECTGCRHWPPFPRTEARCIKDKIYCLEEINREKVIEGVWDMLLKTGKLKNKFKN